MQVAFGVDHKQPFSNRGDFAIQRKIAKFHKDHHKDFSTKPFIPPRNSGVALLDPVQKIRSAVSISILNDTVIHPEIVGQAHYGYSPKHTPHTQTLGSRRNIRLVADTAINGLFQKKQPEEDD